jgi:hypothetical protein
MKAGRWRLTAERWRLTAERGRRVAERNGASECLPAAEKVAAKLEGFQRE